MNISVENGPIPCVHVVDDDRAVLKSMALMLGVFGYDCKLWNSPTAFLETANVQEDDVVVTDLRMPEMDGFELFRALRARGVTSRIVLMTGHGARDTMNEATDLGFFAALPKPFDVTELKRCLEGVSSA